MFTAEGCHDNPINGGLVDRLTRINGGRGSQGKGGGVVVVRGCAGEQVTGCMVQGGYWAER